MKTRMTRLAVAAALLAGGMLMQGCLVPAGDYEQLQHRYAMLNEQALDVTHEMTAIYEAREQAKTVEASAPRQPAPLPAIPNMPAGEPGISGGSASAVTTETDIRSALDAVAGVQATRYTVLKKDTLWSLATRYYGSGKQWTRIRDANLGAIGQNGELKEGQTIIIPAP